MARRAWWPTVETSEATLFARGNVAPAACAPAAKDCCGETPPAGTTCCPAGFDQTILFAAFGPLGAAFALALLEYEVNWDNARRSWIGGTEVENGPAVAFEIWCEEDDEFGQVWWIAGSYFSVPLGARVPFFVPALAPGNGLIVAEVEVPGTATPLTLVIGHPCQEGTGAGGSGGWSSGSDPGGSLTLCGCTNVGTPLYVKFYGALSGYGKQVLGYVNPFLGWVVTPAANACNGGTSPVAFNCSGGTTWILSSPGSGNPVTTTFSATATAVSCSPLVVAFSGTATGACGGAWSAVVSEFDPDSGVAGNNYCLSAIALGGGFLQLEPVSASDWWSDAVGSWRLKRTGFNTWTLTSPAGTVYYGTWDGTGSYLFEGLYTVTFGNCP